MQPWQQIDDSNIVIPRDKWEEYKRRQDERAEAYRESGYAIGCSHGVVYGLVLGTVGGLALGFALASLVAGFM